MLQEKSGLKRNAMLAFLAFNLLLGTAFTQTESVLHNFVANGTDGYAPHEGLAVDKKGNFYGTTYEGGASNYGTVFKVTPKGAETVLYSFAGGPDGAYPYFSGALVLDTAGNLYGTTWAGGANGYGTVFKLTPAGVETVLHSFAYDGTDGDYPHAGLVLDKTGNLYGSTYYGGANGFGTVFKVTPAGTETVLYSFKGGTDGCYPYNAGLVIGKKAALYGTTSGCGASGAGTVFKVTPTGTETVLHSFANNGTDGVHPYAGLVLEKTTGNFYGTTHDGGASNNGTVFMVTPTGTETVLHSFVNDGADGLNPYAGLILDKTGNLYGTTYSGGASNNGTVFELTPSGTEIVLHSFGVDPDGALPTASLVLGKKGILYGTTTAGGTNYGTVFKVVP